MIKLIESSGTVLFEDNNKLYISKRPANWTPVFLFVTALLALILLVNGVLQLFVLKNNGSSSSSIGIVLTTIGAFNSIIFWRVLLYHKKIRAMPLQQLKTIAILDIENKNLLDDSLNILASFDQLSLTRKMQLTSSSPELLFQWDRGSISIVKGNPFSGGISGIENLLILKGIRRAG